MNRKNMDTLTKKLKNKSGSESETFADAYRRAIRMKERKEKDSQSKFRIYIPGKDSGSDSAQTNDDLKTG